LTTRGSWANELKAEAVLLAVPWGAVPDALKAGKGFNLGEAFTLVSVGLELIAHQRSMARVRVRRIGS
jgi:hypothetical protein